MKRIVMMFGLFLMCGGAFAYTDVIERLPGADTTETAYTAKSTGVVAGVSISTSAGTLVTSVASIPAFKMACTLIDNQSSTQDLWYGHNSSVAISGANLGIKIPASTSKLICLSKAIPIYVIANGSAAVTVGVAHYGYK